MTTSDTTFSAPTWLPGIPGAEDFIAYDLAHPDIWAAFQRIAFNLVRHGKERYGAKAIFEVIRYDIAINCDDGDAFKCNNNFTSCYARKLMFENPYLSDFFEIRKQKTKPAEAVAQVSSISQAGRVLGTARHKKTKTKSSQGLLF